MKTEGGYAVYGGNGYHTEYMFANSKIVIGRVGAYCGAVHYTQPYSWITDNALYVREKDPRFLDEYLVIALRYANLNQYSNESGQPQVSQTKLKDVEIPLPELDEQKRIAGILGKADRLRRLRRFALEMSEGYLQAVFLEMFGDPVTNPMGWEVKRLNELVRRKDRINYGVVQPGTHDPAGIYIVRVGDFQGLSINTRNLKKISISIEKDYRRSRLTGDEILISCVGATIGKIALANPELKDFNIARAVVRVPTNSEVNRDYLASYLLTPAAQHFFTSETRTVGQPTLNIEQIKKTPIMFPPIDKQQQFAEVAHKYERLRAQQREALRQADHLFGALLDQAFQGEG